MKGVEDSFDPCLKAYDLSSSNGRLHIRPFSRAFNNSTGPALVQTGLPPAVEKSHPPPTVKVPTQPGPSYSRESGSSSALTMPSNDLLQHSVGPEVPRL